MEPKALEEVLGKKVVIDDHADEVADLYAILSDVISRIARLETPVDSA